VAQATWSYASKRLKYTLIYFIKADVSSNIMLEFCDCSSMTGLKEISSWAIDLIPSSSFPLLLRYTQGDEAMKPAMVDMF